MSTNVHIADAKFVAVTRQTTDELVEQFDDEMSDVPESLVLTDCGDSEAFAITGGPKAWRRIGERILALTQPADDENRVERFARIRSRAAGDADIAFLMSELEQANDALLAAATQMRDAERSSGT